MCVCVCVCARLHHLHVIIHIFPNTNPVCVSAHACAYGVRMYYHVNETVFSVHTRARSASVSV